MDPMCTMASDVFNDVDMCTEILSCLSYQDLKMNHLNCINKNVNFAYIRIRLICLPSVTQFMDEYKLDYYNAGDKVALRKVGEKLITIWLSKSYNDLFFHYAQLYQERKRQYGLNRKKFQYE
eukprot:205259_1